MSSVAKARSASKEKPLHILVVEDQPTTAEMLGSYFETEGYRVDTAMWGKDALAFVQETVPDLLVLDIHLPDMNGYEICRHLRTHERTKQVPIIFLTQKREVRARLKGLELGAVDYVTKPFDIQELRLRVRNVLERSHKEHPDHHITGLPVASLTDEKLRQLTERSDWSLLSVHLRGLEKFSRRYGFVARDDVLRSVAAILTHVRDDLAPGAYIGHLNATDLLMVLDPDQVDGVEEALLVRLNEALSFFYPRADRDTEESSLPLSISLSTLHSDVEATSSVDELRALISAGHN